MDKNYPIKNTEDLKDFIYTDGDGNQVYDYCESCERPIHQEIVDGQKVCEHCKSPNQIMIYEVDSSRYILLEISDEDNELDGEEMLEQFEEHLKNMDSVKAFTRVEQKTANWLFNPELKPKVKIEVFRGIAEVKEKPDFVEVTIDDLDEGHL